MSEIEEALRGLRNELRAALPAPDIGEVTRTHVRRRMQAAVITMVVAVAVAVPVLRSLPEATPPAAPPSPRPALAIDFADERHGYALTSSCAGRCTFTLLATEDGGRTWTPRRLPAPNVPGSGYFNARLYVLDPEHLVIDEPNNPRYRRILSTDGGHIWRPVVDQLELDEPAPPPTGALGGACAPQPMSTGVCAQLGAIGDDGRTRVLPGVPELTHKQVGQAPTSGGRYWFVGRRPGTGTWTIGVSSGREWAVSELDLRGVIVSADGWAVVERNGVMFATATGADTLLGVWRSSDDGRSWVRTLTPDAGVGGPDGTPVVTSDGTLVVSDGRTTWESTDLGHTFTDTGNPAAGRVTWTRGGYLRVNGGQYALSSDGRDWRGFVVR